MNDTDFTKGDYVVLLSWPSDTCKWNDCIPINYVYRMNSHSTQFSFNVDIDLSNIPNGWSTNASNRSNYNKLKFRLATEEEICAYVTNNGPVLTTSEIPIKSKEVEDYTYLIDFLNNLNIK